MVKGNRTAGLSLLLIGIGSFEAIYLSNEAGVYKFIRYTKVYAGNRGFIARSLGSRCGSGNLQSMTRGYEAR
jgi:hypothetical protein